MYGVLGTDGVVYGPITVAGLYEWIAQGRVVPGTVLIDGQGRQMMAASVPELQGAFPIQPQAYAPSLYAGPAKRKSIAVLLAFVFGFLGAHRLYLGHVPSGIAMLALNVVAYGVVRNNVALALLLAVVAGLWQIVDIGAIAAGRLRPPDGQPLA